MNELASFLNSIIEGNPRSKLSQLEWEQLPNEVRNLPRMGPRRRHGPPAPVRRMTPADWAAWQVSPPDGAR